MHRRSRLAATAGVAIVGLAGAAALSRADVPPGCSVNASATQFANVQGYDFERRADAVAVNSSGIVVGPSDGTRFGAGQAWSDAFHGSKGTYFADVTGDGHADAIAVNDDRIIVRRGPSPRRLSMPVGSFLTSAFLTEESWTANPYYGTIGTYFADVTGDGKADAIVVNADRVTVRRSDGTKFLANESWTANPYYGTIGTYFADVTGDRRADAIVVNDDRVTVRRSDGTKFLANESWTVVPYYGSLGTHFVDVTGDGKADAIVVNLDRITVRRSTGSTFMPNESWTPFEFYGVVGTYFADVTGDGKADAIAVDPNRISVRRASPDGNRFYNTETWSSGPFYGDAYPVCLN